jgi:hypothetical protein
MLRRDVVDPSWEERIQHLSEICERSTRTHIAFLGTAPLAKPVTLDADAFAVNRSNTPGTYDSLSAETEIEVATVQSLGSRGGYNATPRHRRTDLPRPRLHARGAAGTPGRRGMRTPPCR